MKALVALIVVLLAPAAAAEGLPTTLIHGTVVNHYDAEVGYVGVTVTCGDAQKSDTTEHDGTYNVIFEEYECAIGQSATACLDEFPEVECVTKQVLEIDERLDMQIGIMPPIQIPEFSLAAAAVALVGGGIAFALARRK